MADDTPKKVAQWFSEGRGWAIGVIFAAGMTYMKLLAIESAVTETRKDFVEFQRDQSKNVEDLQVGQKLLEQRMLIIERKRQ